MEIPSICPQCSGMLKAYTIGPMKDKWKKCEHCGFKIDVPDEAEVVKVEEYLDSHGNLRQTKIVKRRSDFDPKTHGLTRTTITDERVGGPEVQTDAPTGSDGPRLVERHEVHINVVVNGKPVSILPQAAPPPANPSRPTYAEEKRRQQDKELSAAIGLIKMIVIGGFVVFILVVYGQRILRFLGF